MAWGRLDGEYPDHPKLLKVGLIGLAIQTRALCYCFRYLTDGFLPQEALPQLFAGLEQVAVVEGTDRRRRLAATRRAHTIDWPARMLEVGLWEAVAGGYRIHGYLDRQPLAAELKSEQDHQRQAGLRRAAQARRGQAGQFLPSQPTPAAPPAEAGPAGWTSRLPADASHVTVRNETEQSRTAFSLSRDRNGAGRRGDYLPALDRLRQRMEATRQPTQEPHPDDPAHDLEPNPR